MLQTAERERALEGTLREFWSSQAAAGNMLVLDVLQKPRDLASRISDDSNLALDPGADSDHVQDLTVSKLPIYVSELCEVQMLLRLDAAGGAFSGAHDALLLILDALLRSTADELKADLAAYRGNADGSVKRAADP